ncbi:M23 family metallopeptidase [Negadavirga shengliensis]|uniref:M23 family metallopeptidase n=1 Tax=Negadavirga shengliensis TaxID=1389218 RepID=A0ABV9T6L2_9BACT
MKLNNKPALYLVFLLSFLSLSQVEKGYYLFPIKPGEQNFLAGNMSEIRPNHFHTGIDIKTEGREGLPVYAAADGHVYRMKISSMGYGNVLYIRHPNGQATLYAHLRDFAGPIAGYMQNKMYELQRNELEYFPEAHDLPVKKGEIIAYSGNTGSSGGPHLHFEIRDSLDRALDPLHFGFSEIIDTTPPTVTRVALTPLEENSRINGIHRRQEFPVSYSEAEGFRVRQSIKISGRVGIEILAHDKLDGMYNLNGFPVFEIYEKGNRIYRSEVNPVDFDLGRFILVHTYQNRYTRLYKRPNNLFGFYEPDSVFSGAISALPEERKDVQVKLIDAYGNSSQLTLDFEGETAPINFYTHNSTNGHKKIDYRNNLMIVDAPLSGAGELAKFYVHGYVMEIPYAYQGTNKRTYLWNMDLGVPDSVDLCTETVIPGVHAKIPFQRETHFDNGQVQINFRENTLLDDLFLRLEYIDGNGQQGLRINDPFEYLWNNMEVTYHVPEFEGVKEKTHMYLRYANGYKNFQGGVWNGDRINFNTRHFGEFVLATDSIPPRIRPIRINQQEIRFSIMDNLSGIKDFEAWVDGEWVLMRYEHKQAVIWSEKKREGPLKGDLLLKVRDMANNEAIYRGKI